MTFSPNSIRAARRSQKPMPQSKESVASVVPDGKLQLNQSIKLKAPVRRPGHNCRCGQHLPGTGPKSARRGRRRMKHQAEAVDAIAQTGRLRSIVEDMTEMATAAAAMHFGPRHPKSAVLGLADIALDRLIEARPAGATLEFGLRGEQRQVAAGAGKGALTFLLKKRARSR